MASQSEKWHQTRKARMDELFKDKRYNILSEESLDEALETPLGYKSKKGFWLTDGETRIWVGKTLLNQIADEYHAVEKPEPKKRGRPKKPVLDQAEDWAARDIPEDAQQITQPGPTYSNPNQNQEF